LKGQFNVPFGGKDNPGFPTEHELVAVSEALSAAEIACADFEAVLGSVGPGSFAYLDPPYLPLNSTSFFRHYTDKRFSVNDHERLAAAVRELTDRGGHFLATF